MISKLIDARSRLTTVLFALSLLTVPLVGSGCDTASSGQASGPRTGQAVFSRYCNVCHPGGGFGSGPSLIQAMPGITDDAFRDIVRHGKNRMPGFAPDVISDEELGLLLAHVRELK